MFCHLRLATITFPYSLSTVDHNFLTADHNALHFSTKTFFLFLSIWFIQSMVISHQSVLQMMSWHMSDIPIWIWYFGPNVNLLYFTTSLFARIVQICFSRGKSNLTKLAHSTDAKDTGWIHRKGDGVFQSPKKTMRFLQTFCEMLLNNFLDFEKSTLAKCTIDWRPWM